MKSRHAPPRAGAMIEALRGLGYSAQTALADIIDNSIAAHATEIDIRFAWDGSSSTVSILDNGDGMDAAGLDLAMRLGEKNPLHERAADDLGRFGLGLKTASFSQCRRLTVGSISGGVLNCLRWDLDVLYASSDDGWHLLEGPAEGSEVLLEPLARTKRGTLVLWEGMDRIVTTGFSQQDFLDLIDRTERHLAMVFHRYLCGTVPKLRLAINGRYVRPWDPFMTSHSATWSSPVERLAVDGGPIEVQCHVLPHKDKLAPAELDSGGGPDGWTAQQGFYVYRNERLLVAGSWLGLGRGRSWTKEESHRLARIRLDISNSADIDWKIDIRKSTARPPVSVRERLYRLAEDTRERARRVFAHRGNQARTAGGQPVVQAWQAEKTRAGIRYRVDTTHPAVAAVLSDAGPLGPRVRSMLRVLEETVPVQRIWLDTAEAKETPRTGFSGAPRENVIEVLQTMFEDMITRRGMSGERARQTLLQTEPFHNYPELVASLIGEQDDLPGSPESEAP
jgi:hypothetical protein